MVHQGSVASGQAGVPIDKPDIPALVRIYGVAVLTLIAVLGVMAWLVVIAFTLDETVVLAPDGKTVLSDPFGRTKDILVIILPILTTLVGYWVGTKGMDEAKKEEAKAKSQREAFKEVALDAGGMSAEQVYQLAREKRRIAFE